MVKQVKNMKFKSETVTICYGRNGHRLYEGSVSDIPENLKEYWCGYQIYNKYTNNTYIEVTEDEGWWKLL